MRHEYALLFKVVTLREAAYHWKRDPKTIMMAADKGYIAARYCGRTQLITVESMMNHYGDPAIPLSELLAKL